MAEYKETHIVRAEGAKSPVSPWLAFAVGALLITVIALLVMNVRVSSTGPDGSLNVNIKPPVTAPASPPAAPAR